MLRVAFGDGDFAGVFGGQLRGESHVLRDGSRFEPAEVLLIHPRDEVLEDVWRYVFAERLECGESFVGRHDGVHRSIPE